MRLSSYAGDTQEGSVRGGHLYITNDGEFDTSIVKTRSQTLTSQLTSYVLGRKRTRVLPTEKSIYCRITDVVKAGYLDKQGSWFKTFKRRYFVLRGDISVLSYYESNQSLEVLLGSLHLRPTTTIVSHQPQRRTSLGGTTEGDLEYNFLIKTPTFTEMSERKNRQVVIPEGELLLRAKSEEERKSWIEVITFESKRDSGPRVRLNKELDLWNTLFSYKHGATNVSSAKKARSVPKQGSHKKKSGEAGGHTSRNSTRSNDTASVSEGEVNTESTKSGGASIDVEKAFINMNVSKVSNTGAQGRDDARSSKGTKDAKGGGMDASQRWKSSSRVQKIEEEDSDDEHDVDFDIDRFRSTTAIRNSSEWNGRYKQHTRKSNRTTKYKQPKKSDPQPAPTDPSTDFSSFVTSINDGGALATANTAKTVRGTQICLELCNMVQNGHKVFVMLIGVFAGDGSGGSAKESLSVVELYRTEEVEVTGTTTYGMPISKCHVYFSTMSPVLPDKIESVCAAVFNADVGQEHLSQDQKLIDQCLCYYKFPRRYMKHRVWHAEMTISSREERSDLTNPNLDPKSAQLGMITVEAQSLYYAREKVSRIIPSKPYSERLFSFRIVDGSSLSNEQIFASIYSVETSRALLDMIVEEREPILAAWLKHMETEVEVRKDEIDNQAARSHSDVNMSMKSENLDMLLQHMYTNEYVDQQDALISLSSKLEQAKETYDKNVCDLEDILVLYDGVTAANLDTTDQIQNLIPGVQAGGYLRRSPWKKASLWQYATTNLNVHLITSSLVSNDQMMSGSSEERRSSASAKDRDLSAKVDESILFSPVITLGVPAAHDMKFKSGGLTRILAEAGFDSPTERKFWMESIQNSECSCRDLFQLASLRGEKSFASMKKLLELEKVPDSQLSNENWGNSHMEVQAQVKRFELASRIEICVSQLLGFACCTLRTIINLATLQPSSKFFDVLVVSMRAGFFLPLQSLLSTQGNERGMIEDLDGAVLFLRGCDFKVMKHSLGPRRRLSKNDVSVLEKVCVKRNKRTKCLCVHLYVTDEEAGVVQRAREFWNTSGDVIPPPPPGGAGADSNADGGVPLAPVDVAGAAERNDNVLHADGNDEPGDYEVDEQDGNPVATLKMVPVIMTQGVNEMQTAVNSASYMNNSALQLQVTTNRENLCAIETYVPEYRKWYLKMTQQKGEETDCRGDKGRICSDLAASLAHLKDSVDALEKESEKKHVSILTEFAYLSRSICGTVGILCKSGKDRTGMSATLELVRSLVEDANLIFGERAVTTLRDKGARRMNVWANTGQSMFAFNSIQRTMLPACYRPPHNTFSGNVAT